MRIILLVGALGLLGGCASTGEMRGLANQTGGFVSSLSTGTSDFLENQNRLNAANAERLDQMVADGSVDRANVRQQRLAWADAGDTVRIATAGMATRRGAEDIIAGLEVEATAPLLVRADSVSGYATAQKSLAEAATKPTTGVALQELLSFGQAVHDSFVELQEKTQAAQNASEASASAADSSTAASAATTPK